MTTATTIRTLRTIHVDGQFWNAYFEGGEYISLDGAVTDISARCNVHPCSVKVGVEYTYPAECCTTDSGQHVRETLTIVAD